MPDNARALAAANNFLQKTVDKDSKMCYNKINKRKGGISDGSLKIAEILF